MMGLTACTPEKPESNEAKTTKSVAADHNHTEEAHSKKVSSAQAETIYTCPMHPQIRQPNPGRCPICGMELVLAETDNATNSSAEAPPSIEIPLADRRLAGIKTILVTPRTIDKQIEAVGTITFDESRVAQISAYVDGRVERLYADYTGVRVKKGDHLAVIYSPELYEAQVEFLQIRKSFGNQNGELLANARSRLKELGMIDSQIRQLERSGKPQSRLTVYAPRGGTVIQKPVSEGQYFKEGQTLFKIADLSTVWLVIDAFPEDAALIHYGQKVTAHVSSQPNDVFTGRVAFIDPIVSAKTRTVQVRVEMPNPNGTLKPGAYAETSISAPVTGQGSANKIFDPKLAGKWISPMHPQITRDEPGNCPICGMKLVPAEQFGFSDQPGDTQEVLVVPREAVLKIGQKAIVFVKTAENRFELRRVQLGDVIGDKVVVVEGLHADETIASEGVFLIDSQMQLTGQKSLISLDPQP
jgi:Cu(I)/Ag(I) efflux system membrane fusion protein